MASKSKVYFFNDRVKPALRKKGRLKEVVESVFRKEGTQLEQLNYIFCDDERLLEINRQFLNHDFYTDIVTFILSGAAQSVVGEAYISVDRVRDNANQMKVPFSQELARVVLHGALHLCGYSDKTKKQVEAIRKKEDFYLKQL